MALKSYAVDYELDSGVSVKVVVKYDEDNSDQRLNIGNFDASSNFCAGALTRRQLKPRHLKHVDLGQIYFKKHSDMVNYIKNNKEKILFYRMEDGNCAAVQIF